MRKTILGAIAFSAIVALAGSAGAQKIDANGRCHAANGEFAKAEVCAGVKADTKAAKADAKVAKADAKADKKVADAKADATKAKADTKADAKVAKAKAAKCKDAKGKFAKCGTPGATPVT